MGYYIASFVIGLHYIMQSFRGCKLFAILSVSIFLVFFAGFRAASIDGDYAVYAARFYNIQTFSLWEILFDYSSVRIEPGFALLTWVLSIIGLSHVWFFLVVAIISISIKSYFIYRYSVSIYLSFFVYFSHLYLHVDMIQVRGGMAVAILLFAIQPLAKREFFNFLCIVLFAGSIHFFSLVVLFFYPFFSRRYVDSFFYIKFVVFMSILSLVFDPITILDSVLGGRLDVFDTYLSWDRYNYSLGFFNPVFLKQLFVLIVLHYVVVRLRAVSSDFYYGALYLYALSTVWLFVFRDFAILGARGASFMSFFDYITLPACALVFRQYWVGYIFILLFAAVVLYLNIDIKGIIGEYKFLLL